MYLSNEKEEKIMLQIAILFSGSASSVRYLIENDPHYTKTYSFAMGMTDNKDASGRSYLEDCGIPCIPADFHAWRRDNDVSYGDTHSREEYFAIYDQFIKAYKADIILLSGFMLIITPPLLGAYHILNVHPSGLHILDENGKRKYTGADAVTDAINAGETQTFSTIHLLNEEVDGGPIVTISDPLAYRGGSVADHQERMKTLCDGPAYATALKMITSGDYTLPSLR